MTAQDDKIIVTFDGEYLSYEQDGQLVKIPAFSGQPGYQNPNENQDDKNYGLLPTGTYNVKQSRYQNRDTENISWLEGFLEESHLVGNWPGGTDSWGTERVWLEPAEGTRCTRQNKFINSRRH
jgi:hypothetical protein